MNERYDKVHEAAILEWCKQKNPDGSKGFWCGGLPLSEIPPHIKAKMLDALAAEQGSKLMGKLENPA